MVRACFLFAIAALAACTGPTAFGDQLQLSGSYQFDYTPPDGSAVTDAMAPTAFFDPTTAPSCCLQVYLIGAALTIDVGSWLAEKTYPDPVTGACPAVAAAEIEIDGIGAGPQTIDVGSGTAVMLYHQAMLDPNAPADPCPQSVYVAGAAELTEPIALSGRLEIDQLACAGGETTDGDCALQATGSWAIEGIDEITKAAVLFTNGAFAADDQRL